MIDIIMTSTRSHDSHGYRLPARSKRKWSSAPQKSRAGYKSVAFYLLCSAFILSPPILAASTDVDAFTRKEIRKNIESHRINIQRLQLGIHNQQDLSRKSVQKEKDVLHELEEINQKLQKQLVKVSKLEQQTQLQQELIATKEQEISQLQTDKKRVLHHFTKRGSAYYKMGKIGFLNVTFSSRSLPELLRFQEAFQTMIEYDQNVIRKYRAKIHDLERARDAYALEKGVLQEFIANTRAENEETAKIRAKKEQLLTHIRTQKHLHDQAVLEMEASAAQLSANIIQLKSQEEDLKHVFSRSKGKLPVPLSGEVITFFNQEKTNNLGVLRKSTGIAIDAPEGSRVQAIADGTIIFSGYLRGYGNTIIIHHGYQYYSITSRLDKIAAKKGDNVKSGSYLGLLSETGTLLDEGLYFEIRHGKESQDPLQWIDTSKLDIQEAELEFSDLNSSLKQG